MRANTKKKKKIRKRLTEFRPFCTSIDRTLSFIMKDGDRFRLGNSYLYILTGKHTRKTGPDPCSGTNHNNYYHRCTKKNC